MKSIVYIKAQLSKLKQQQVEILSSKKGGGEGYAIKKSGHAQVAFIGFPSVGKSSILNLLTDGHTHSKVADYDFTTIRAIPGMMEIEHAKIQLIDLPGIILGAAKGKGRGKEILSAVRNADLILIIICFKDDGTLNINDLFSIRKELYDVGIRLNQTPPKMEIKTLEKGGIGVSSNVKQSFLDDEMIKTILYEYKIRNAAVFLYEDLTPDRFIDGLMGNRRYIKELVVINKIDLASESELNKLQELFKDTQYIGISAKHEINIKELKHKIFEQLELMHVYLKQPGKEPDLNEPMILKKGSTIENLCLKIHKDFVRLFKYAQIWGKSAKYPGQKFQKLDHILEDGDIVTIYLKK